MIVQKKVERRAKIVLVSFSLFMSSLNGMCFLVLVWSMRIQWVYGFIFLFSEENWYEIVFPSFIYLLANVEMTPKHYLLSVGDTVT